MKRQTDIKSLNSLKGSPATKQKIPCHCGQDEKDRRSLSISSSVSWLQVWKQLRSWLSLLLSTCWRWKKTQREVEKKVLQDQLLILKENKRPRLCCVSQNSEPMNSILRKARELELNASAGHTWNSQDAPGTKSNSGKKRAIWRHCPKRWTSWATSLRASFEKKHLRKPHDKQIVPAKYRGLWRENMQAQTEDNYVLFSCEGARDTEDRMFGMDSGASMHNAEQGDLSSDKKDIEKRSKTP